MTQVLRPKKLPRNYRLVYDVVSAMPEGRHASAAEVHSASRSKQAGIGYSTVYRALDRLRELGLVLEVRVPGSPSALYEAARAGHAHFRCDACGRIDDIAYTLPSDEIARVRASAEIDISDAVVTFNGLCRACRAGAHV